MVLYLSINYLAVAAVHLQVPLRRYIPLEGVIEELELCQTVVDGQRRQITIVLTGYRAFPPATASVFPALMFCIATNVYVPSKALVVLLGNPAA